jgi:hypothetical protein
MTTQSNSAQRAEAAPNLRERAERLRDAAGRFVRRKTAEPSEGPERAPIATVSPALASMVTEWVRLAEVQDSGVLTDEEADAISPEWSRLHGEICRFPARSMADLTTKAPLYRYERDDERASCDGASTMPLRAWESVVHDIESLSTSCRSTPPAEPILAAITETRRLTDARTAAAALLQPAGSIDPLPEQDAAMEAFFAHVEGVLLKTVPTTAVGCAALARYAVEFLECNSFVLDEDEGNEHVRILGLIAQSPLLDELSSAPTPDDEEPVTLEGAASLSFEAYALDEPVLSPTEWGNKLNDQIWGLLLTDRLLRMGKAEMETFIREAGERNDETPEAMYRALDAAQVTLEGWGKLLDAARCRYMVAASSAVLGASHSVEG